jgi:glutaminyl-tRNA synthetase
MSKVETSVTEESTEKSNPSNFIRKIIDSDIAKGTNQGKVHTRFPPEPNGFLHIGHCKSICINFGFAQDYQGHCNLRFDDTNPEKESDVYVDAIKKDIAWLGWQWFGDIHFASDYFDQLFEYAVQLIKQGDAYVCALNADEAREYRGTLTETGKNSPHRNRSIEQNLSLFEDMRAGKFENGALVLRAKIDMTSPNMNMRDPIIYRIRHVQHHQTGDKWCVYPMYDFTHSLSDAIEGITHSLCTLEFEDHRPLYEWFLEKLDTPAKPQQIEFSRLELENTITSKRKLLQLIEENHVSAWDDPRMPTISGMRRRGFPASALREFVKRAGVSKSDNAMEMGALEVCVREELESSAKRTMGVLNPLKVIIENYPVDLQEQLTAPNHPKDENMGSRTIFMTKEVYIDQDDFRESANKKFKRLVLGGEVRLRNSYVIKCLETIKNNQDEVIELRCSYDPETLGKNPEGRKVKGVIHWVSASESLEAEVRLYDRLFTEAKPDRAKDGSSYLDKLNPKSLIVLQKCRVEKNMKDVTHNDRFQFEREGYFCTDEQDSSAENLVFNRIVGLRDTWNNSEQK